MAKAIFHRDFHHTVLKRGFGWHVKASPLPQTLPRELIDAGVAAGAATLVPPKRANPADEPDNLPDARLHLQQPSEGGATQES